MVKNRPNVQQVTVNATSEAKPSNISAPYLDLFLSVTHLKPASEAGNKSNKMSLKKQNRSN